MVSDLLEQDEKTITFVAVLMGIENKEFDKRHLVRLTKKEGTLVSNTPVTITREQLDGIFKITILEHLIR